MGYSIYIKSTTLKHSQQHGIGIAIYNEHEELIDEMYKPVDEIFDNTTLELMAVIDGIRIAESGDDIYTDSDYCVRGVNEWLEGWKRKGWKKSDGQLVRNIELWKEIDWLIRDKFIHMVHVKSYNRNECYKHTNCLAVNGARGEFQIDSALYY